MSASPTPPAGAAPAESPKSRLRAVSRSKSFYQAFLDAKSGNAQQPEDQKRSLDVVFPELYKKALLSAYATRPPEDDDAATSGPKGRFSGAASRLKTFIQSANASGGAQTGQGGVPQGPDEPGTSGTREQVEAAAGDSDGDGGRPDGATAGDEGPLPSSSEPCDPAAAALAEGFRAMASGEGGPGGGGMMGQLKKVFDTGGALDSSQEEGGGPGAGGAPDPNADLKKALQQQMEDSKGKMDEATDGSFKELLKGGGGGNGDGGAVGTADGGGGGGGAGGAGFFASVREAAQQKLQQAREAAAAQAQAAAAASGAPGAGRAKPRKAPEIEIKSEARPPVPPGKDPWLPSGLSPRQVELRRTARDLAASRVLPHMAAWDRDRVVPRALLRAAGRAGFCGMVAPLLAGGRGWSYGDAVAVLEVLGAADLNSAAVVAHQNCMAWMVAEYAGLLHRLPLTAALSSGVAVGTCAASEPGPARKDPSRTLSFAVKYKDQTGDYWILNGFKDYVPLGGQADMLLVAARTDPSPGGIALFLLPKVYPGMMGLGPMYDSVGVRSLGHHSLVLGTCIVRDEVKLAAGEEVVEALTLAGDRFRLFLAAAAVGAACTALALATGWVDDPAHRHFAHPLSGYQALQHRVAALAAKVDSARLLVQHAAAAYDSKAETAPSHAAMAKRFAVTSAFEVLEGVRTLFGAASVHVSYPLDRVRRNLIAYRLLGGDMEECSEQVWSGLVSKRRARGRRGAGKKTSLAGKLLRGAGLDEEEDSEGSEDDGATEEEEEEERSK